MSDRGFFGPFKFPDRRHALIGINKEERFNNNSSMVDLNWWRDKTGYTKQNKNEEDPQWSGSLNGYKDE